jgi:hypothetical protein
MDTRAALNAIKLERRALEAIKAVQSELPEGRSRRVKD